ncbi:unnamed protein product [Protopolystoma xenopodis]|uniref:Uncharacterized protein n=1 Tax=Protopolystoma xenopodis TaxID=117903 RepID=A0A448WQR1_9PLAT|nr:unnamed protein product [Protopolystoma xenopodis]
MLRVIYACANPLLKDICNCENLLCPLVEVIILASRLTQDPAARLHCGTATLSVCSRLHTGKDGEVDWYTLLAIPTCLLCQNATAFALYVQQGRATPPFLFGTDRLLATSALLGVWSLTHVSAYLPPALWGVFLCPLNRSNGPIHTYTYVNADADADADVDDDAPATCMKAQVLVCLQNCLMLLPSEAQLRRL